MKFETDEKLDIQKTASLQGSMGQPTIDLIKLHQVPLDRRQSKRLHKTIQDVPRCSLGGLKRQSR